MKLLVKAEGGPSPGITVVGERNDLLALADRIRVGVESREQGIIQLEDAQVQGEPREWLAFELVKNLESARDDQNVKAAPLKIGVIIFLAAVVAVCYLAFRGLQTFF